MSRSEIKPCPLCDAKSAKVSMHPTRDAFDIDCPRCGRFLISGTLYAIQKIPPELKPRLSAYTRQFKDTASSPEMLSTYNLESLAQRIPEIPPSQKPDLLLNIIKAKSPHPGATVLFSSDKDYPLILAMNPQEALFHLQALVTNGLVNKVNDDTVIVTHKGWERQSSLPPTHVMTDSKIIHSPTSAKDWDVFICHASEDKTAIVEPLVAALRARGLRVWYDRTDLTIGDSLRRKIDEGLAKSRFGIVILSMAFFGKAWPEQELDGLVQKEIGGQKVILPVWHGVTHSDVVRYSPLLAGRLAGSTDMGIETLADELLQAIKTSAP